MKLKLLFLVAILPLALFQCTKEKKARYQAPIGLSCEEATDSTYSLESYRYVHESLSLSMPTESISYLDCFLPNENTDNKPDELLETFMANVFNADVLYEYLDDTYYDLIQRDDKGGREGGFAWLGFHAASASVIAYQQTGEKRFIDQYITFFNQVMDRRDSKKGIMDEYHGMTMNSWGSYHFGDDKWVSMITHFAIIMQPATSVSYLIQTDSTLAEYSGFKDEILAYFKPAYVEFDVDIKQAQNTEEKWYWRPIEEKFEATNHIHLLGHTLVNMYKITGDEFYADRIRWIIRVFEKGVMIDEDGLIAWNYHPYLQVEEAMSNHNAQFYSEKVWKAGLTIPFLYEAEEAGFLINPDIISATTKTIREHVVANNTFASNLHPRESMPIEEDSHLKRADNQEFITMFLIAAKKDPEIAQRIKTIIATHPKLYENGWLTKLMSRGYAHFLEAKPIN